ncbi:MAG: hypothetical protein QNJ91_09570 [Gammaproteobacteria bacterium]|nr:hypothetical protein [Gammaproteobacteria bacterium]
MYKRITRVYFPVIVSATMLTAGMTAIAEPTSTQSIVSDQARELVQEQDQTQFRNRRRLEERINGKSDAAAQQRNRYREQRRTQDMLGGRQPGGRAAAGQGIGRSSASGRRMAGSQGGGTARSGRR